MNFCGSPLFMYTTDLTATRMCVSHPCTSKIIRLKAIIIDTVAEMWHKKLKIVRFIYLKLRNTASDLTTKAKSGIIPQNYEVYISKTPIKTKKSGPEYP